MRVLSLDTTTRAGSAALVDDDRVVDERRGDGARNHALRLPAELIALAAAHRWLLREIDLFAVASGPGSFTGLRIGIATMQGLALVNGRRMVAVSALEALAHAASGHLPAGAVIGAWMDAHRHEIFAGLYRVQEAKPFSRARLTEIGEPSAGSPAATLARWQALSGGSPAVIAGDGAVLYAEEIARDAPATRVAAPPDLAGAIGLLAVERAADALEPSAVRPLYVRRPDVEILRDEKLRQSVIQPKHT